ncbi:hypothetical protein DM01DRAFT_1331825, partial [Hesseltinella vesiculosa]
MHFTLIFSLILYVSQVLSVPVKRDDPTAFSVTSPAQGADWALGESQVISWAANTNAPLDLVLMQGTSQVQTIAQGLNSAQGSYIWSIPVGVSPASYEIAFVSGNGAVASSPSFVISLKPTATVSEVVPATIAAAQNQWTASANVSLYDSDGQPRLVNQHTSAGSALLPTSLTFFVAFLGCLFL